MRVGIGVDKITLQGRWASLGPKSVYTLGRRLLIY